MDVERMATKYNDSLLGMLGNSTTPAIMLSGTSNAISQPKKILKAPTTFPNLGNQHPKKRVKGPTTFPTQVNQNPKKTVKGPTTKQ